MSTEQRKLPDRPLHRVTLRVHTEPRDVEFYVHADSPEHAIEKGKKRLGPGMVVESATAVRVAVAGKGVG